MALVILYGLLSPAELNMFIVPAAYFRFAHKTITATVWETSRGPVEVSISRGSISRAHYGMLGRWRRQAKPTRPILLVSGAMRTR